MLTAAVVQQILERTAGLTVGVLGDLFLDRYLDIDPQLTEPSIETGLDAYQVVRVRPSPGAAGTVINNLAELGVKRVLPIAVIGDDGEGYELKQCLRALPAVDVRYLFAEAGRRTPTYTKPILHTAQGPPRELNRLDIKNRSPLPRAAEQHILAAIEEAWPALDALLVQDQVSEAECGVITTRVREELQALGQRQPDKLILADSRERIGLFRSVCAKPNEGECAMALANFTDADVQAAVTALAARLARPVFCTRGSAGILVVDPRPGRQLAVTVPAYPVNGPIDIVGAGDSCSAAIACALAAGAELAAAAAFGNLVASITIQQIGTTGTATPAQVRKRWRQVSDGSTVAQPFNAGSDE